MGTITLPIDDMLVVHREVEIPDICPYCGVDLKKNLEVTERQLYLRAVDAKEDGTLEYYSNSEGFDGEYAHEWRCMRCNNALVTNNEIEFDNSGGGGVLPTQLILDLFTMLDRRILSARRP